MYGNIGTQNESVSKPVCMQASHTISVNVSLLAAIIEQTQGHQINIGMDEEESVLKHEGLDLEPQIVHLHQSCAAKLMLKSKMLKSKAFIAC